ncbi:hypothetical protein FOZ61_002209 [Perkinsus olseni]|uniref:Uncharacterized protein n=2 Tax=Perkinsus olseni TaxID=32597 RepID=A0A7J6MEX8_PEROL|nr:hypothetical protein FOZ61_002209 [Perkinsus olseni]KAF4675199.1 hypothetical protein FOL46_002465 [Perkinsus olseni]
MLLQKSASAVVGRRLGLFSRAFASWKDYELVAKRLDREYPAEDPRTVNSYRIKTLALELEDFLDDPKAVLKEKDAAGIVGHWKHMYDARLHAAAYSEMAEDKESCQGESSSWEHDRISVEKDPTKKVADMADASTLRRAREADRAMQKDRAHRFESARN